MALIFYLSSNPAPKVLEKQFIPLQDKWLHMILYLVLAVLIWRGFFWEKIWEKTETARWSLFAAIVGSAFYGATDEWHQAGVSARTADWADWIADAIGAALLYRLRGPVSGLLRKELSFHKARESERPID